MRVFDLIYRVKTLRVPFIWLVAVLAAALLGWTCSGCRVEYRTAADGTYAGLQVGPPAGPLDPQSVDRKLTTERPP